MLIFPPHYSYVTLCILFTVHKKLSVAHTGYFNHTNHTLKKRHYITPHSASVKQKKSLPTLPIYEGGISQEPDILLFGLNIKQYLSIVLGRLFLSFCKQCPLFITSDPDIFKTQLITWHKRQDNMFCFKNITDRVSVQVVLCHTMRRT